MRWKIQTLYRCLYNAYICFERASKCLYLLPFHSLSLGIYFYDDFSRVCADPSHSGFDANEIFGLGLFSYIGYVYFSFRWKLFSSLCFLCSYIETLIFNRNRSWYKLLHSLIYIYRWKKIFFIKFLAKSFSFNNSLLEWLYVKECEFIARNFWASFI